MSGNKIVSMGENLRRKERQKKKIAMVQEISNSLEGEYLFKCPEKNHEIGREVKNLPSHLGSLASSPVDEELAVLIIKNMHGEEEEERTINSSACIESP